MFVHSLVRAKHKNKYGWRTPLELGEAAPHYISYAVPVSKEGGLASEYECEVVMIRGEKRDLRTVKMLRSGGDAFALELTSTLKVWFHLRPIRKEEQRLPYVGTLRHEDFQYPFTEIEPDDLSQLDQLCEDRGVFIVGCDPERHYSGRSLGRHRQKHLAQ